MTAVRGRPAGELALVLHTHMPYVEGFGTWPFGEEWLWEAMATCYLPLLEVLDGGAPVTLSLTPVLGDQLDAPGVGERFTTFLRDVRARTHRLDAEGLRQSGHPDLALEVERAANDYAAADRRFEELGGDLMGALAPYASWTSAASHAVLPLLATDAGARLQIHTGVESHKRRFGDWGGGFWLPECAYARWLEPLLAEAGARATCLDLTDVLGPGAAGHLAPLRSDRGLTLVPVDRTAIELVWSDRGYPAHGTYRDYHHHTIHHHRPWGNDGRRYDHSRAIALAREHAADFVARVRARLAAAEQELGRPGLCVCALDTELLGHWWYEGVAWLSHVIDEAQHQGLALARLDDALARHEPLPLDRELPETTWGTPRDLSTWSGPQVAELAWRARAAELDVVARGRDAPSEALRELLALQASDWAFMISRALAGPYPAQRAAAHAEALAAALHERRRPIDSRARNLAPECRPAPLLVP